MALCNFEKYLEFFKKEEALLNKLKGDISLSKCHAFAVKEFCGHTSYYIPSVSDILQNIDNDTCVRYMWIKMIEKQMVESKNYLREQVTIYNKYLDEIKREEKLLRQAEDILKE